MRLKLKLLVKSNALILLTILGAGIGFGIGIIIRHNDPTDVVLLWTGTILYIYLLAISVFTTKKLFDQDYTLDKFKIYFRKFFRRYNDLLQYNPFAVCV